MASGPAGRIGAEHPSTKSPATDLGYGLRGRGPEVQVPPVPAISVILWATIKLDPGGRAEGMRGPIFAVG